MEPYLGQKIPRFFPFQLSPLNATSQGRHRKIHAPRSRSGERIWQGVCHLGLYVTRLARTGILGVLIVVLYADVLPSLVMRWWEDEGYSHAFLVVPLAGYLAWRQRPAFRAGPVRPDAWGLFGVALACALHTLGRLGAEFFLTRFSLVVLLAGLVWTFWGRTQLRRLAFPLLLLASSIPLPVLVYNRLAAPLQLLASAVSTELAHGLGISVYRDGNVIHLAHTSLGVAEACSGLRSVSSLTVAALLLAYLELRRPLSRLLLVLLAVPIAILSNVARVTGTALLSEHDPALGAGFYHSFSGWLVFLCGLGLLWVAGRLLRRVFGPHTERLPA